MTDHDLQPISQHHLTMPLKHYKEIRQSLETIQNALLFHGQYINLSTAISQSSKNLIQTKH